MNELVKPQLDCKKRRLEVYDGNQLTPLESLTCDVDWHKSKHTQKRTAVVNSDKDFGLLGRSSIQARCEHGHRTLIC